MLKDSMWLLAQAAAEGADAADKAAADGGTSGWVVLGVVIAVLVLPFVIGGALARFMKLKDYGFKIGAVLCAAAIGLTPFIVNITQAEPTDGESKVALGMKNSIRLGIDLAGGTNLVFQAKTDDPDNKPITDAVMDQMVGAVGRRINPSGTEEVVVRKVGRDRIEIIIPGADPERVKQVKSRITRLGSLEFAILANERQHSSIIAKARAIPEDERDYRNSNGMVEASWRDVGVNKDGTFKDVQSGGEVAFRDVNQEMKVDGELKTVRRRQFLVVFDKEDKRVTGEYLTRASQTLNTDGSLAVAFNFNVRGATLFQELTTRYQPKKSFKSRLAILLDNQIHSAPSINDVISDRGIISGSFTLAEVQELVAVLNAGALEVPLKPDPISEFTVSPLIGEDVIRKGMTAFAWAGIAVLIFMLFYYRVAGVIADVCLIFNLILVMGTMSLIRATFTLPGLAGIVLTVGMAVDANVLIFERIREEIRRGSSFRMSIQNGFAKAFSTIIDANVTTLITAVILFYIGTDQVRGFAVTLFIGIVMSMFSALFFGRLLFDIIERKRLVKSLSMTSIIGETNYDFVGKKKVAAVVSAIMIVAGMGTFFSRGEGNLDIDFTGGTMVTFQLKDPAKIDDVRKVLKGVDEFGAITLERLQLSDEDAGEEGRYFRLRTTRRDSEDARKDGKKTVQQLVADAFEASSGDYQLRRVEMSHGAAEPIAEDSGSAFAGGRTVELTFTAGDGSNEGDNEITKTTVLDYLTAAVNKLPDASEKFPEAENLFEVDGVEGSGMDAVTGEVAKFSKVKVKVYPALNDDLTAVLDSMEQQMADSPVFDEVNSFDSSVAAEMQSSAVLAIIFSLLAIVAYIWFRFQAWTFGVAAVAALVHDVLVVLGVVAIASKLSGTAIGGLLDLYDFKINLAMIAAFMTIVGYSLNDTIVVFDRIREVRGKNPALTEDIVNRSLNQTLSRTLLTSVTTFLVVLILYFMGGEGIHGFAFCLVIGVLVGTYSSIYVASPVLLWLMNRPAPGGSRATNSKNQPVAA